MGLEEQYSKTPLLQHSVNDYQKTIAWLGLKRYALCSVRRAFSHKKGRSDVVSRQPLH
jgi:hypothetical protein